MKSTRARSISLHPHGRGQALRTRAIVAAAITAAVVIAGSVPVSAHAAELGSGSGTDGGRAVVKVEQGVLRGSSDGGVEAYLGIPYAAPPVGERRFAAPEAPERWPGVRSATSHAPACLQAGLATVTGVETSEDCLYLDVYRPDHKTSPTGGGREDMGVLVWLHGGAFAAGSGALFDARELAERTNTVVVTMNYRLGALGYLATESQGPDAGNAGLRDQIAALEWVRENIRSFGGDPAKVAVAGQSAGAMSICGLLVSPRAEGYFSRAVLQSGPCTQALFNARAQSIAVGEAFATGLGCPTGPHQLECLRGLDADSIMSTGGFFTPTYGVPTVPEQPQVAIAAGRWHRVPVLVGSTKWDYIGAVGALGPDPAAATAEQYAQTVMAFFGPGAEAVLQRYPAGAYEKPAYAFAAVMTDAAFGCGSFEFAKTVAAQSVATWQFEFDDPTSPTLAGQRIPGIDMASSHSAELAYLFDYADVERPLTAHEKTLAHRMMDYWGDFAASGILPWAAFSGDTGTAISLSSSGDRVTGDFAAVHHCEFWGEAR
jgi:para-nitrobenzyl esterase